MCEHSSQEHDVAYWDKQAEHWNEVAVPGRHSESTLVSLMQHTKPLIEDWTMARVLDFGCGTGELTRKLSPLCHHVVAVDTSQGMLKVLTNKVNSISLKNVFPLLLDVDAVNSLKHPLLRESFELVGVVHRFGQEQQERGVRSRSSRPLGSLALRRGGRYDGQGRTCRCIIGV
jgi:SAM-dependent methyltransferase